jgi:hypothetical protein
MLGPPKARGPDVRIRAALALALATGRAHPEGEGFQRHV